jgi:hypothetical protein
MPHFGAHILGSRKGRERGSPQWACSLSLALLAFRQMPGLNPGLTRCLWVDASFHTGSRTGHRLLLACLSPSSSSPCPELPAAEDSWGCLALWYEPGFCVGAVFLVASLTKLSEVSLVMVHSTTFQFQKLCCCCPLSSLWLDSSTYCHFMGTWRENTSIKFLFLLFLFFWQHWGVNSGPHAC